MPFLLLLTYVLSSTAAPGPPADPHRRSDDTCQDINNCRTLFQIVWGCLATIFAFTWVSVHPNVPPPHQSAIALFWRKLKMMLIAIMAPEIMVGFAHRQLVAAWRLSKEFDGFSITHGFFFAMGGFVGSSGYVVAMTEQLEDQETLKSITSIDVEDLKDRGKGDPFSKGVALAQGLWFITQCLARVHQHLVVTQLEVATMAFAVMNVFTWLLWWHKPLGVERHIVVGTSQPEQLPRHKKFPRHIHSAMVLFGHQEGDDDFNQEGLTSVPDFWSSPIPGLIDHLGVWMPPLSGTVFACIHWAALGQDVFPTSAERVLWGVSSVVVLHIPWTFLCMIPCFIFKSERPIRIHNCPNFFLLPLLFTYIIARLFLITLPFAELRFLPSSAFRDVDWRIYIPHL
ncbi:hypothetical protein FB45DRAFT_845874 [Roridomyces roridus]|uniref:Uncharacterized protein n=1 Tax=Roridomyces roridus TaxID=1738132 RepID=A0AAD7B2F5_9AGAR|nr:hypothetical protein FB45DRAFT_845874 [Roridomyces roridus]